MIIKCAGKRCNKKIPKGVIKKIGTKFFCSQNCYEGGIYHRNLENYQRKKYGKVISPKEAKERREAGIKKGIENRKKK